MRKNNLRFALAACLCILQITAVTRDPFTCMVDQPHKPEMNKKTELPINQTTHSNVSQEQWTVKQMRKNAVVLQDAQGNIREISFSDTEK